MRETNHSRQNVISIIIGLAFAILIIRLFFLQIVSSQYDLLALDNAVSKKVVYPDRGIIFDRKVKSILQNTLTYDLMVLPNQLSGLDTAGICKILQVEKDEFHKRVVGCVIKNGKYRPSVFEGSLSDQVFVQLQENMYRFEPGFFIQERPVRGYPY